MLHTLLAIGQTSKPEVPRLLEGLHFGIQLSNGFNTTRSNHVTGDSKLSGSLVHQHAFQLHVEQYLGQKGIFISAGAGFGMNGFVYKTDTDLEYPNSSYDYYYNKLDVFPFASVDMGVGYSYRLSERWIFKPQLRAGIRSSPEQATSVGHSTTEGRVLDYRIETEGRNQTTLRLQIDFTRILKNDDLLAFGLYYTHTNSLVYSGSYFYPTDNSAGTFTNYGREVGISVGYIFSGYSRKMDIYSKVKEGKHHTDAKKSFRKQRRTFGEKSWVLGARSGVFGAKFIAEPNSTIQSATGTSTYVGVNFLYNVSKNAYLEGDLSYNTYSEPRKTKYYLSTSSSSGDFLFTLSSGYGYRVLDKNNYNWLNVSGGLNFNFVGPPKGMDGSSEFRVSNSNGDILLDGKSDTYIKQKFYPGLYLTLNKDFRIGANNFISFSYTHTEGFYPVIVMEYETNGLDVYGGNEAFDVNFKGRTNTFSIGVKHRFNYRGE